MKKLILLFSLIWGAAMAQSVESSQHYWVFFKDKDLSCDPSSDFSPMAIARRARAGEAFPKYEDFPVNEGYVNAVAASGAQVRHTLRWFNCVTVSATAQQLADLANLPCVAAVQPMALQELHLAEAEYDDADSTMLGRLYQNQSDLVHLQALTQAGLTGRGVRVAVFDAGFTGADTHVAFAHMRDRSQIKLTHDFVSGDDDVYGHSKHGTAVLSCIGGMYEGRPIGGATEAEFLLARTERNLREPRSEEDNWMAAAEWADQNGADIISSSLGYSKSRYTYADMDGRTTLVTRAAAMAVRKGILVVNSAGNEGSGKFRYIAAPGDADSVLTVGGSYPMMAYRMPFSSIGPSASGVLKPEICGPGYMIAAHKKGGYSAFAGTSFACPMVAGMAACLLQQHPAESNMQLKQRIVEAGSAYPYFDYAMGYGVLDARRAVATGEQVEAAPTFAVERRRDTLWVEIDKAALALDSAKYKSGKPFSFHILKNDGKLASYKTILLTQKMTKFGIPRPENPLGKVEMWFQGYMWREE